MRNDRLWLVDILEAIDNINRYADRGKDAYLQNELYRTWIIHHIQIIGEAASKITQSFKDRHSEIPWVGIIAMRNVLVHHYFGIDYEQIWDTVTIDIPVLKTKIDNIFAAKEWS